MKKRLIPIIAFATMTLTSVSQSNWKMNEAVNTLADMEEWKKTKERIYTN